MKDEKQRRTDEKGVGVDVDGFAHRVGENLVNK